MKVNTKYINAKRCLPIAVALALVAVAAQAAPLSVVEVGAPAFDCIFNTNCTSVADDSSSPVTLPGGTGTGFMQTRVIAGQPGSSGEGLSAYLYRIDLTGIKAVVTDPPCVTNIVKCATNRIEIVSTNVVCRTNVIAPKTEVKCETQRIPGTNIIVCYTSKIPAHEEIRCGTNDAGVRSCITNIVPEMSVVRCYTNRSPSTYVTTCVTNTIPGSNVVYCSTNRVTRYTNNVICTNLSVPCDRPMPCIEKMSIRFGRIVPMDYDGNGTNEQVFLITKGGVGAIKPASVEQSEGVITIRFSPALCAGDGTVYIGLASSNAPGEVRAYLGLTSGAGLAVAARAPIPRRPPITCDLTPLYRALGTLTIKDLAAPTDRAASGRRGALINKLSAVSSAAQVGDLEGVLENIEGITEKLSGDGLNWLTPEAATRIRTALLDLLNCLQQFNQTFGASYQDHDDN
jgi:hypothetical protein